MISESLLALKLPCSLCVCSPLWLLLMCQSTCCTLYIIIQHIQYIHVSLTPRRLSGNNTTTATNILWQIQYNTRQPLKRGQPPKRGQRLRSQWVLCSEVRQYTLSQNNTSILQYFHPVHQITKFISCPINSLTMQITTLRHSIQHPLSLLPKQNVGTDHTYQSPHLFPG